MIIRRAQLDELERVRTRQFESELLGLLREEFPERSAGCSDADLLAKIYPAVYRARDTYGLTGEEALVKFVYLSWLLGEDFDLIPQHSWIHDILLHDRPCSERMEIIMFGVSYHLDHETETLRLAEEPDIDGSSNG